MPGPFDDGAGPFGGLPENLLPNPPPAMPEAPGAGDAMASASPFKEPLDLEQIYKNLLLDRPLKFFIPREILAKYSDFEFRFINNIPQEVADAHNKGFRQVDDPDLLALISGLIAGTDKGGNQYGLRLFARPKIIGDHVRKANRKQLASIYAGMDPKNKNFEGKYTENVDARGGTKASFEGPIFRIRT